MLADAPCFYKSPACQSNWSVKSLRSRRRPEAVEVMEKPKRRQTDNVIVGPDALAAAMTDRDVARRAYELYVQRRGEHGHDLFDDWLQAEREHRGEIGVTVPGK